jgi:membrane fusion protein
MSLFRPEVLEHRKSRLHGDVILSQPLSTRVMTGALFAIVAIAGLWVWFGTYARIETVQGILTTSQPTAKVLASSPGVVIELNVEEGQLVRAGERLATINLDRRATSGEGVAGQGLAAVDAQSVLTSQQGALSVRRMASERDRLERLAASAERQLVELEGQIELQTQVVASNQSIFDQSASVVEKGYVSRIEYERRRQALISSQQNLANLRQQILVRSSEAEQATGQMASLAIEAAQSTVETASSQQALVLQQSQLEGERAYVVTAPIDGRVTALQAAKGRTAQPGIPLMILVPDRTELRAELYAPTRAIGFVSEGQETRILFDAFPYQRFGSFGGRVQSVSRIVIDPRETEVPLQLDEPVYRVTVALDRQIVAAYGETIALQPGMTLQANLILERQSFLGWLLQPLNAVLKRTS